MKKTDGLKLIEAIRTKLDDDLIIFENGLNEVDDLPKKITAGSSHA